MVILDDHAHDGGAGSVGPHLHGFDLAGNGSVNGHTQTLVVADLLTHGYRVTFLDQRHTGAADVLLHGNYQNIRLWEGLQRFVLCKPLILFGMDASKKGKSHSQSPRYFVGGIAA